ncbi:hypothetical protein STA1M1_06960 [Sinisalibacter aestuarii]|uniref:IclR family transcriptional regulator n=2 Tax=Sinisalibacter aestuarii TaxID=2949426 RepID=A0ABQ5LRX1_9RHOB|nr:hypothetical protein STA1M1_06960 [Sinisalibacter aestuarii]
MVDAGVPVALKELSAATGLTPAQVHGYLTSFRRVGLASQHSETSRYELGSYALRLGLTRLNTVPCYANAGTWLFDFSSRLDLMAMLTIFTPKGPTAINVVHAQERRIDVNIRLGTQFSTVETATGRMFMAFDSSDAAKGRGEAELHAQGAAASETVPGLEGNLRTALADARESRVLVVNGALVPGIVEIATPIFDEDGQLAAVATFLGHEDDLDEARLDSIKRAITADDTAASDRHVPDVPLGPGQWFDTGFEPMDAAPDVTGKGVQSIETAARLLQAFVYLGRPATLKELAASVGITPALAHAYLVSLKALGLVTQDTHYRLGPFAMELGLAYLRNFDPMAVVRDWLPKLSERIGHTVLLSIWGAFGPTVISVTETARAVHMNTKVGSVYSVTGTATGRAFAAFMPHDMTRTFQQAGLPKLFTERCVGVPQPFGPEERDKIRRLGFATVPRSLRPRNNAIAAPIFDLLGQVFAVVTIIGDTQHLSVEDDSPAAGIMVEETRALSHELGYIAPHAPIPG